MRVLYFHQHFSTPRGATGIRSYWMARSLVERGHRVTMVCGTYSGGDTGLAGPYVRGMRRGTVDGMEVLEFELRYSNRDSFLRRTATFLRFGLRSIGLVFGERYDLLFATTTPLTAGVPGIVARWLRSKPFVFEVRDLWPELPRAMGVIRNPVVLGAMSFLEWLSYRSADRLIGLAPGIVEGIAKRGVPRARIGLVPNGCDLDLFEAAPQPWRPQGVAAEDLMAVYAGTIGIANGLGAVLDVAAELKRRGNSRVKLVLIGQGKLRAELEERARRERLDNVIFHDPVPKARLASLMAATDVGLQILANVSAFYYGTSPNKFFDYLAAGIAVLTNYPGWVAELIEKHACGIAVPPDDPGAFADALERLEGERRSLREMGARARRLAASEFDRRKLGERFVEILEAAAARA
jgi:glycosyltransferase involved in cell wall biosynthesis